MSSPILPSPTVAALHTLRPSGAQSIEELVSGLLSKISGVRLRLCKAGTQLGVDALAEIPFGVQVKRHEDSPRSQDLLGGLAEATLAYPDLQLWVLVSTAELGAIHREKLLKKGESEGIGILILDAQAMADVLPGVSAITALAASDISSVTSALDDPAWRDPKQPSASPDLRKVREELEALRVRAEYAVWQQHLQDELQELPIWGFLVQRHNARLRQTIDRDALLALGTDYDPGRAVPRAAEQQISSWWDQARGTPNEQIAVVTGDRYDGKTWTVYSWLRSKLDSLAVPAFFVSSARGVGGSGDIEFLVLSELRASLGSYGRHAKALLSRQRRHPDRNDVWALVVLDGMNEYVTSRPALSRQIRWAVPASSEPLRSGEAASAPDPRSKGQQVVSERSCAILATTRSLSLGEQRTHFGARATRTIPVGPYSDPELAQALAQQGLTSADLQSLSSGAQTLLRRPRYLDLVVQHQDALPHFTNVTADVLYHLDASDKIWARTGVGSGSWDPERHKSFLAAVAGDWLAGKRLDLPAVRGHLQRLTQEVELVLADLRSEGLLHQEPGGTYMPQPERLAFAMGLFIRRELLSYRGSRHLREVLRDLLAPHGDDDEKVRWLRAATVVCVLSAEGDAQSMTVTDTLVSAWLSGRNLTGEDLREVRSLAPFILDPLLRAAPSLWGAEPADQRLEPIIERVVVAGLSDRRQAITGAVKAWLRVVPVGRCSFIGGTQDSAENAELSLSDPSVADLGLTLGSEHVVRLQRFALHLEQLAPGLLGPLDILALLASRHAVSGYLEGGEGYVARTVLSTVGIEWFQQEVAPWVSQPSSRRARLLAELLAYADRSDLAELRRQLPDLQRPPWSGGPLSAAEFNAAVTEGPVADERILDTARHAAHFAIDPASPKPPPAWRARLGESALRHFGGVALHAHRAQTRQDFELERLEPALAAWSPEAGTAILAAQLEDIPRRIAAKEVSWSYDLFGHAALFTSLRRTHLRAALLKARVDDRELRYPLEKLLLCLLPGLEPEARLEAFLSHPFREEWSEFYDLLASSADDAFRELVVHAVRTEDDPLRVRRARYLLGSLGSAELNRSDLQRLCADADRPSGQEEDAASYLLRRCHVPADADESILKPLVRVARTPEEEAWQYAGWLHRQQKPDERRGAWVARAISARETASRRLPASYLAKDDVVIEQALVAFLNDVQVQLSIGSAANRRRWEGEFPDIIVNYLTDTQFDAWVEGLLADAARTQWMWPGVLVSVTRRALRSGHERLAALWKLSYPFQRSRSSSFVRFTVDGLHWSLSAVQEAEAADTPATNILSELILDCRSDQELLEVVLAARNGRSERLRGILENLLADRDASVRARARFMSGWLPQMAGSAARVSSADPAGWVERIGREAAKRLDRERFATHWIRRFLSTESASERWAAGRLFLSCADAATRSWAFEEIFSSQAASTTKGEALLLLRQVRARSDDSDLQQHFLGYDVREVESVVAPWRQIGSWEEIETTEIPDESEG